MVSRPRLSPRLTLLVRLVVIGRLRGAELLLDGRTSRAMLLSRRFHTLVMIQNASQSLVDARIQTLLLGLERGTRSVSPWHQEADHAIDLDQLRLGTFAVLCGHNDTTNIFFIAGRSRSASPRGRSPSRSASPETLQPGSILVERLTKNVTEAHLREIFGVYGTITTLDTPVTKQR